MTPDVYGYGCEYAGVGGYTGLFTLKASGGGLTAFRWEGLLNTETDLQTVTVTVTRVFLKFGRDEYPPGNSLLHFSINPAWHACLKLNFRQRFVPPMVESRVIPPSALDHDSLHQLEAAIGRMTFFARKR